MLDNRDDDQAYFERKLRDTASETGFVSHGLGQYIMGFFVIALGIVLVAAGLYFAKGGIGGDNSGGGFKDIRMEGPAWLILVVLGVAVVIFGAVRKWNKDIPTQATSAIPPSSEIVDQDAPGNSNTPAQPTAGSQSGLAEAFKDPALPAAGSARLTIPEVPETSSPLTTEVDGLKWTTDTLIPGLVNWNGATAYCDGLTIDGLSFKLPLIEQLKSIADPDKKRFRLYSDAVKIRKEFNAPLFTKAKTFRLWSSEISRGLSPSAYAFDFKTLESTSVPKNMSEGMHALCVERK